jgi:hypothetical protein
MLLGRIEDRPRYRYHNDLQFFIKHPLNITPSSQNTSLQTSPFSPPQTPPESQLQPRHPSIHPFIPALIPSLIIHTLTHSRTPQNHLAFPGGYFLPSFSTCGVHAHHSSLGTLSITFGTWLPQPCHVVLPKYPRNQINPSFFLSLPLKTVPPTPSLPKTKTKKSPKKK